MQMHKRALRVVYRNFGSSYLMIEVFKSLNPLNPAIMWNMFLPKPSLYNLRSGVNLKLPQLDHKNLG